VNHFTHYLYYYINLSAYLWLVVNEIVVWVGRHRLNVDEVVFMCTKLKIWAFWLAGRKVDIMWRNEIPVWYQQCCKMGNLDTISVQCVFSRFKRYFARRANSVIINASEIECCFVDPSRAVTENSVLLYSELYDAKTDVAWDKASRDFHLSFMKPHYRARLVCLLRKH
jgi:hypothetical protein